MAMEGLEIKHKLWYNVPVKSKDKNMQNTPIKKKLTLLALAAVLAVGFVVSPLTLATPQDEINRLRAENAQNNAQVRSLADQAASYEDAIRQLSANIAAVQAKINDNTAQQNRLNDQIIAAEKELAKQRDLIGQNIRSMYLDGDISTLEMLASSKDLSDFVDKEQYKGVVQNKIRATLEKIQELRLTLKAQKEAVELLLKDQAAQRAQLASSYNEQSNLLTYNQSQRDAFNAKTKQNSKRIDELIAAQRRANFGSPDGGYYFLRFKGDFHSFNPDAYPYRNAGFGMSPGGCADNDGPDRWGYCTRQCVSFAAWAVEASGRNAPRYYGNARDWVAAAYAHPGDVDVYRSPEPGDVAISTSGYWGHAMYVTSVNGSKFSTWEYNGGLNGQRSDTTRSY